MKAERKFTPEQKVWYLIIAAAARMEGIDAPDYATASGLDIEQAYTDLVERGDHWDAQNETRECGIETGLPCPFHRNYETKAVAAQLPDGTWVGWTHYYGGGKHGEPSAVTWIEDAYDVDCFEEQKLVTVQTFTKGAEA